MKRILGVFLKILLGCALLVPAAAKSVEARLLGDPATDLPAGGMEVGLSLSTVTKEFDLKEPVFRPCGPATCSTTASSTETDAVSHTTVFFDYGATAKDMIRGEVSQADYGVGSANGTEVGVNYRHTFTTRTLASGKVMTLAGLAGYETGTLSGDNFGASYSGTYAEYQVAFGGSIALQKGLNAYFAGIVDNLTGSISNSGNQISFMSHNPVGGYGGADFLVTPDFMIGGEFHVIFEQGFALYGTLRF
jgi:hypothetical protein